MFEDDSHDVRADSDHHRLLLSLRHRHVSQGPVFLRKHIHVVGCTTLDVKLLCKTCQLSVVTRCKLYSFIFTASLLSCKSLSFFIFLSITVCARVRVFVRVVGSLRAQASVCLRICVYMCMYMCLSIRLFASPWTMTYCSPAYWIQRSSRIVVHFITSQHGGSNNSFFVFYRTLDDKCVSLQIRSWALNLCGICRYFPCLISVINPFVYSFCNSNFRLQCRRLLVKMYGYCRSISFTRWRPCLSSTL